jgi:hypothetical protein
MENNYSLWRKIWQEAEPIVIHAAIVLLLEFSLLLIGLVTLGLEYIFPKQEIYFSILEMVDIWLALILLCMFGLYTLICVGIRLAKGIREETDSMPLTKKKGA